MYVQWPYVQGWTYLSGYVLCVCNSCENFVEALYEDTCKDMCFVQGRECTCKEGKDVSPEDEAAALCPCLSHLHKVLTRSLTDFSNFLCKIAATLLGS